MKETRNKHKDKPDYKPFVVFTKKEERRIKRAMESAIEFMAQYGRGRSPYLINRSRYINSTPMSDGNV